MAQNPVNAAIDSIGGVVGTISSALNSPITLLTDSLAKFKNVSDAVFGSLNKLTGAVQSSIATYTQLFNPAATKLLDRAIMDLNASIGQALMPTLEIATAGIKAIGNVIAELSPQGQKLLVALTLGGIAATVTAAATGVLTAMVAALAVAEDAATFGLSGLVAAIGGFIAAIAVGGAVMASASKPLAEFQKLFDQLSNVAESLLDTMGEAFQKLAVAATPLLDMILKLVSSGIEHAGGIVGPLIDSFTTMLEGLVPILETVVPAILGLLFALHDFDVLLIQLASLAIKPLLQALNVVLRPIAMVVEGIALIIEVFTRASRYFLDFRKAIESAVLEPFNEMTAEIERNIQPAIDELKRAFADVGSAIGEAFTEIKKGAAEFVKNVIEVLRPVIEFVVKSVVVAFQLLAEIVKTVAGFIRDLTDTFRDLLGIEPEKKRTVDPNAASGLAVRQAQTGSVESFIDRARTAAFSAGRGSSTPAEETAKNTATMSQNLATIASDLKLIKDGVLNFVANPVGSTLGVAKNLIAPNVSGVGEAGAAAGLALRETMRVLG